MTTGKRRRRSEHRLVLSALSAAAFLLLASPAFASPVAGDRYEGVYLTPPAPLNTLDLEATPDFDGPAQRLVANLIDCREPAGLSPIINFQVNRSANRTGFFTAFRATNDATGETINITLEDAPGAGDDVPVTRGGLFPGRQFDLSGTVRLANGQETAILPDSKLFLGGGFARLPLNRSACGRPNAEVVFGAIIAVVYVTGPNGEVQIFDSDISPFGGYACTVSVCDRAPGSTAQGRSRRSALRGPGVTVLKRGSRTGAGAHPAAATAVERMVRRMAVRR